MSEDISSWHWIRKAIPILFGLMLCCLAAVAITSKLHYIAAAFFSICLVALGAILIGFQFVSSSARPLTNLLGLEEFSSSRFDKPEYNLRIGRNFLDAKYYRQAYDHALRMIRHYPNRTDAFEIAYRAAEEGGLGDEALNAIDELAARHHRG